MALSLLTSNRLGRVVSADFDQFAILCPWDELAPHPPIMRGALLFATQRGSRAVVVLRLLDVRAATHEGGNPSDALLTLKTLGCLTESDGVRRFAGDIGALLPSAMYQVWLPDAETLQTLLDASVPVGPRLSLGKIRFSETHLPDDDTPVVSAALSDIYGRRTAVFGKTRNGKSNVVKLMIDAALRQSRTSRNIPQLIFDVNGEYANDNQQDGGSCVASSAPDMCRVFYLSEHGDSRGKLLRLNLYEQPHLAVDIISELLSPDLLQDTYVRILLNCRLPTLAPRPNEPFDMLQRRLRKIMLFWSILHAGGFEHDEMRLTVLLRGLGVTTPFNPAFSVSLRMAAYQAMANSAPPPAPHTFLEMVREMQLMADFLRQYPNDPNLKKDGVPLFDTDGLALCAFLRPPSHGLGPYVLRGCTPFHSPHADDFVAETLKHLDEGMTVIVDLGSASEKVIRYFARTLSMAIFTAQEQKFLRNELGNRQVQVYFEEAHMIFPVTAAGATDVYARFAKEGAKFNIGIVYCTQSPLHVNHDLLAQTENFFVGHLSSRKEADALALIQRAFEDMQEAMLTHCTVSYMLILTLSGRHVLPIQMRHYRPGRGQSGMGFSQSETAH